MSPHMEQGNFEFKLPGCRNRPTVGFQLKLKGHGVPFIVRVILPKDKKNISLYYYSIAQSHYAAVCRGSIRIKKNNMDKCKFWNLLLIC